MPPATAATADVFVLGTGGMGSAACAHRAARALGHKAGQRGAARAERLPAAAEHADLAVVLSLLVQHGLAGHGLGLGLAIILDGGAGDGAGLRSLEHRVDE
jgi:hypothetical protein